MMVVHLKSTSHYDNTEEKTEESRDIRLQQAHAISEWVNNEISKNREVNLVIAGDFNDSPLRKKFNTLYPLLGNKNLEFLTSNLKSCKYRSAYVIDQIVITHSMMNRYLANSAAVYDFFSALQAETSEKVSDHCPVTAVFDVSASGK